MEKTDLLERYLQAVRFLLPKKQRHDVDREISEDLRSQIEEKESELGRPLDERELTALLKGFGHPALLALRYQPERHLIGPAVFPLYWFGVRFVLATLAIVYLLLPAVFFALSGEPVDRIVGLFLRFPAVAVPVLGWLTLAFAVLDTRVVRNAVEAALAAWTPESLPPVAKDGAPDRPSVAGLVLMTVLNLWWLVGLRFPHVLLGPGADALAFGPGFLRVYVPMAVAGAASIAHGWIRLTSALNPRLLWISGLVTDAIGLVVLYFLWRGRDWFVAGPAPGPGLQSLVELANLGAQVGLSVALVVSVLAFAWKHLTFARTWSGRNLPPRST